MKRNVFIIYSPRRIKIEPASFKRIDTDIAVFLFENSRGLITPKFNDELKEISNGQHRLWIEMLNRSFVDSIVITKKKPFGFLVIESENVNFKHVPPKKGKKQRRRRVTRYKKKDNLGDFLPGMILLMLAETLVIKQLNLHPE